MRSQDQNQEHKIIERLELPQDIILGVPLLSMQGNAELMIENHRGLLQYDSDEIRVRTKTFTVQVTGRKLTIQEYRKDVLIIRGWIERMQFLV